MKSKASRNRLARKVGIALGAVLAAALLLSWRVPSGAGPLGADVRFSALQTGAIGVSPLHPFLHSASLRSGESTEGSIVLRNQTGLPMSVRLTALPSAPDLDRVLHVAIEAGGRRLFDGRLGALRAGSAPLRLGAGRTERVTVGADIPAAAARGWQGRIEDVSLQIHAARAHR